MRHTLTNVDMEARTGDCVVCGPGVRVKVSRQRGGETFTRRCWGPDSPRRRLDRARQKRRAHGMTSAEAQAWLAQFRGICQMCGDEAELVVDHCHATKAVRGGLCRLCNSMLGMARDEPRRLQAGIDYLGRHGLT